LHNKYFVRNLKKKKKLYIINIILFKKKKSPSRSTLKKMLKLARKRNVLFCDIFR